ncbi:polyketide synthase dehydratase domain-containing protein, partial [Nocardia sp. 2YAB30]
MLAVAIGEQRATDVVAGFGGRVSVAAVNGPSSTVLSGDADAIEEIELRLASDGVKTNRLRVSHAFHSARMDPMLAEFRSVAERITYRSARFPLVSNVSGELAADTVTDPEYWVRQVRGCVRFAPGVDALVAAGVRRFVEIGPDAVLAAMTRRCLVETPNIEAQTVVVAASRRSVEEPTQLLSCLTGADVSGVPVDWAALFAGRSVSRVPLPTYAFRHEQYWLPPVDVSDVSRSGLEEAGHPLLGALVRLPDSPDVVFTGRLSRAGQPWLADHVIAGVALLPGAAFVELVLHVGTVVGRPGLAELVIEAPLPVPSTGSVELRVVARGPDETGARTVSVYSRSRSDDEPDALEFEDGVDDHSSRWVRHVVASVIAESGTPSIDTDSASWPPAKVTAMDIGDAYPDLAELGYGYGPVFRGLTALWRGDGEVFAEVALPESARSGVTEFGVHPALLDAALHAILLGGLLPATPAGAIAVPFSWENVALYATGATTLRVRAAATGSVTGGERIAMTLTDTSGMVVAEVGALMMRPISADALGSVQRRGNGVGYDVDWVALPTPASGLVAAESWSSAEDGETVTIAGGSATVLRLDAASSHYAGSANEVGDRDLPVVVRDSLTALTARVQRLLTGDGLIVVVTRQAVAVHPGEPVDMPAAAAWGLLRTAQSEHPERILLVDVDDWADYRHYVALALAMSGEPQLAVRHGSPYAPRLNRADSDLHGAAALRNTEAWALTLLGKGTLTGDNFGVGDDPSAEGPLVAGQVRVSMRAVGLNFRDVLVTLGTYPDPDARIGCEGAGVVLEVAADVTEFVVGDRVFGFMSGVGSAAVVDHRLLAPIPQGWS